MSFVKIKKAKIKDDLFLECEYTESLPERAKRTIKSDCTVPVHSDMVDAFAKLSKHLSILCDDEAIPVNAEHLELMQAIDHGVRSFTIGGSDEHEGVVISGYKKGRYGLINLNSPFMKWENEDYMFTNELYKAVQHCIDEVCAYLFEGKRAPEQQMNLFEGVEDEVITSEE